MRFSNYASGYKDENDEQQYYEGAPRRLSHYSCKNDGQDVDGTKHEVPAGTVCEASCNSKYFSSVHHLPEGILKYKCVAGSWEEQGETPKNVYCTGGTILPLLGY